MRGHSRMPFISIQLHNSKHTLSAYSCLSLSSTSRLHACWTQLGPISVSWDSKVKQEIERKKKASNKNNEKMCVMSEKEKWGRRERARAEKEQNTESATHCHTHTAHANKTKVCHTQRSRRAHECGLTVIIPKGLGRQGMQCVAIWPPWLLGIHIEASEWARA